MSTTWPDAYATVGITPADLRLWRVVLQPRAHLSPVALWLMDKAPLKFKQGKRMPIREVADHIGYSLKQTHTGLQQLTRAGYVVTIPLGGHNCGYAGNPALLLAECRGKTA